jgi:hypothetical protein
LGPQKVEKERVDCVARSRQVCINWVVEALLVAIYLERKDGMQN